MQDLKNNLEAVIHYATQIRDLVDVLFITNKSGPGLNEASNAVCSAIDHLTIDMKDETMELEAGIFQQHKEAQIKTA